MSHREKTGVAKWIYTTSLEPLDQLLADVPLAAVESPEFPSSCTTLWGKVTRDIRMQTCQLNSKVLHSAPFTHLTAQGVGWRVVTSARRVPSPLPKSTTPQQGEGVGFVFAYSTIQERSHHVSLWKSPSRTTHTKYTQLPITQITKTLGV